MESFENLVGLKSGDIEKAAPNFTGGEATGREACDDAKVISAAFQSLPEVWIS